MVHVRYHSTRECSPQELRDLVSEHKTPDKIMELTTVEERAADEASEHKPPDKTLELTTPGETADGVGQEKKEEQGVSPVQDDICEMMLIPRLPILDEVSARKSECLCHPDACSTLLALLGYWVTYIVYDIGVCCLRVSRRSAVENSVPSCCGRVLENASCLGHAKALVKGLGTRPWQRKDVPRITCYLNVGYLL